MVTAPEGFAEFVAARSPALLRSAWLLTGDWFAAQDLVQVSLAKTWPRWHRVLRRDDPEVYVRRIMINTHATWRRRRWHGERPTESLPERALIEVGYSDVEHRDVLRSALSALPRRQRAVIVLRYFDDLTEQQTAMVMGCAVGTVKSTAARALASLRRHPSLSGLLNEEGVR